MNERKKSTHPVALILGNVLVFVLILFALEGAARVFAPRDVESLFSDRDLRIRGRPFVEPHETRGFALKPGFENETYSINASGFRGPSVPGREDVTIILAIGESTTFGWEVGEGADYPALLEDELNTRIPDGEFRVVNAGVPSYSSSQVRIYLDELLARMKPDVVLINILWNDIWFSTLTNWYPDVLVFQQPKAWQQALLKYSALYRAIAIRTTEESGAENVFNQGAFDTYLENVRTMIALCRESGVEPILVHPPFDGGHMEPDGINPFNQVRLTKPYFKELAQTYLEAVEEIGGEVNVPLVDHRLSTNNPEQPELFIDLLHPQPEGNAMMAEDIADYLVEHRDRLFRSLPAE